jgi:Uma2 family endonuclease
MSQSTITFRGESMTDSKVTLAEYIEREETSLVKHEFHNGKLTEMPGGTPPHAKIALNFGTFLNLCLFKKTEVFNAYSSDARLYITELDKNLYADVSVVAGDPILFGNHKTLITNPLTIIEVLSDGTDDYDRNDKFELYQEIPTLKEYVLVHQNQPKVEVFYCKNGKRNVWVYTFSSGLESTIKLSSVGCTLRLKDIYRNIKF